jgi:cell volume regulation protein A
MSSVTIVVTYFAFLLGFGVIIASILKKRGVPDTLFLIIFGLLVGPTLFSIPAVSEFIKLPEGATAIINVGLMGNIPDFLRVLALILMVFTGAFNLKMKTFKQFSDVSIKIAIIGALFNIVFVGFFAHFLLGYSVIHALLLASIISGTGAGVVISFEKALSKYERPMTILKMESILNSPLSIIFPPGVFSIEPVKYATQLWQMIAVGVGAGFIVGFAVSKLLKKMIDEYTSLFIVAISFVTYALAENVGGSGILAVAVCGLITGNLIFPEKQDVKHFDDQFSEMLRISIFTLFGAQVLLTFNMAQVQTVIILFLLMFFSRPIFVIPLVRRMKESFSRKETMLMCFIAPRGSSEAAMAPIAAAALIAAGQAGVAADMMNIIFMLVILSVMFSTGTAWLFSRSGSKLEVVKIKKDETASLSDFVSRQSSGAAPPAESGEGPPEECEEPEEPEPAPPPRPEKKAKARAQKRK